MSASTVPNPANVATPPPSPNKEAPASKPGVTSDVSSDGGAEVQPPRNVGKFSGARNSIQVPLAIACGLPSDEYGVAYNFREHERVQLLLQIFACVEVISVKAFISVDKAFPITSGGVKNYVFRHGLAPKTAPSNCVIGGATISVAHTTPRLVTSTMNPMFPVPSTAEYTSETFPPGMQTDLRAVETRHPYLSYLVLNDSPTDKAICTFRIQLDFIVECSGENFGVVGL